MLLYTFKSPTAFRLTSIQNIHSPTPFQDISLNQLLLVYARKV